jgi:hypothetical protein
MNTKFNLGSVEVKVPAGEYNPEINVAIKDVSYEVTDLSLTEYGAVFKGIFVEATKAIKDFGALQEEQRQKQFEREQALHEMRMQEIATQAKRDEEREARRFARFNSPEQELASELACAPTNV